MFPNRRSVAAAIAATVAAPSWIAASSRAGAQSTSARRPLVANLRASALTPDLRAALLQGFRELGLEEGRDFDLLVRSTGNDPARSTGLVAELVELNPAVIIGQTTQLVVELARASKTIPIVASTITDPIGLGLAQSIARPGGNVTGVMSTSASSAKLVEMLLEFLPGASRIGVLLNPSNVAHVTGYPKTRDELAARSLTVVHAEARLVTEIEPAFRSLREAGVQAMIAGQDALFNQECKNVAAIALAARLPLAYGFRIMTEAGGLMTYGTSLTDHQRRAGWLAAKILKGEKTGDLPIEQNAKVELVINAKTARALGLTIPPVLLARADEVIE